MEYSVTFQYMYTTQTAPTRIINIYLSLSFFPDCSTGLLLSVYSENTEEAIMNYSQPALLCATRS